jgi:hypothetical protein
MNKSSTRFSFLALLLLVAMVVVSVQMAAAAEGYEWEITGKVIYIEEDHFVVEIEENETIIVYPGEDFELSDLKSGDTVRVTGTENKDGSITATMVELVEQEDDGDPSEGYFCDPNNEQQHPFGEGLAQRYEVDYETLQAWFCNGFGWGQIMLALETEKITDLDLETLLDRRADGEGWGEIWQDLSLIGRPEDAGPPEWVGEGRPEDAGPPEWVGEGRPDDAGPPEGVGEGRPDDAGPPEGVGEGRPEDAGPPSNVPGRRP